MGEAIAALVVVFGLLFLGFLGGALVTAEPREAALQECAEIHNVYKCEWFAEARPVK